MDSYRKGYPRVSAIIGETPEYQIFRRFRRARARLILAKQDRVAQLEEQLDQVDLNEKAELFLGNMRRDKNQQRIALLADLDEALGDYGEPMSLDTDAADRRADQLLQRNDWVLNARYPRPDALQLAQDWRNEEGSIARAESAYIHSHRWELLNVGDREHLTYTRFERGIERFLEFVVSAKNKVGRDLANQIGYSAPSNSMLTNVRQVGHQHIQT